jgi:hypothetical protein
MLIKKKKKKKKKKEEEEEEEEKKKKKKKVLWCTHKIGLDLGCDIAGIRPLCLYGQ